MSDMVSDSFTTPEHPPREPTSARVLILAPVDGDAAAISTALGSAGFEAFECADLTTVSIEITRSDHAGAGAVIAAQEAFSSASPQELENFAAALGEQPGWSDIPLILLAGGGASGEDRAWEIARGLDPIGNVTILERPLRRTTLLNAVAVALRARQRQYELRATLRELAQHRERLRELVERKTAELAASIANLHASERLASLGTLAAGLGHDIANLTLPIRARLDALRASCPPGEAQADFEAISRAIAHLSQLSAGMRLMAMDPDRESASSAVTDLAAWAAETMPLFRAALPRHVRFEQAIAPGLRVRVARHRLAQAVFNLVQNAGEAMMGQASGIVRIAAEAASPADGPGGMVRLTVADNGPGMPPSVRARCFEPYFSTKGRAISTGMGLGLVKGVVEAAGGTISLETAPNAGCTFTILLPSGTVAHHGGCRSDPAFTAAVSIGNERIIGLARMFVEHAGGRFARHEGHGRPGADVWALDKPDAAEVASFLESDPHRRVVVLGEGEGSAIAALMETRPDFRGRLRFLPATPTASALREALTGVTRAKTGAAG
ncbi:MAG TPA: HAMP domain-containing sensor histidine kinase [Phycisphaerales bacterium]|nr:HAMP domain-containing sensor histidine kinase [Phycisphaerales bacterium]